MGVEVSWPAVCIGSFAETKLIQPLVFVGGVTPHFQPLPAQTCLRWSLPCAVFARVPVSKISSDANELSQI